MFVGFDRRLFFQVNSNSVKKKDKKKEWFSKLGNKITTEKTKINWTVGEHVRGARDYFR